MRFLTVFTPTYNRRDLLPRLYDSLVAQTDHDFVWLVVDDGSTDDTEGYIRDLQSGETLFSIEYYRKENGGLHTGYNEAIKHLSSELCLCCDSDDWLPSYCVERVRTIWRDRGGEECAGIIGLDCRKDGSVIGSLLPEDDLIDMNELFITGRLVGDKKLVVRSELYKALPPMRTICGEKNFNPNYLNVQISEEHLWIATNECLCCVEYQPGGMTAGIYKQYVDSPNSFMEMRRLYMGLKRATFVFKCRHAVHYDAECLLARRSFDMFGSSSPSRALTALLSPAGFLLYLIIKAKVR